MSNKFKNVPNDPDTRIIFETECRLDEYDVLYQRWIWQQIVSESFIFADADVAALTDKALEQLVRSSPMIKPDSEVLIRRPGEGFVFASFNSVSVEDLPS